MGSWLRGLLNTPFWAIVARIDELEKTLMAQIDDLKALLTEQHDALDAIATAVQDVDADVTKLLDLVTAPGVDLTEVIAQATALRDKTAALATSASETAGKYDSSTPTA